MTELSWMEHIRQLSFATEKEGSVCSFCGASLPATYYLLLATWRSQEKEITNPAMRFCSDCWQMISRTVETHIRQLKLGTLTQKENQ